MYSIADTNNTQTDATLKVMLSRSVKLVIDAQRARVWTVNEERRARQAQRSEAKLRFAQSTSLPRSLGERRERTPKLCVKTALVRSEGEQSERARKQRTPSSSESDGEIIKSWGPSERARARRRRHIMADVTPTFCGAATKTTNTHSHGKTTARACVRTRKTAIAAS